MNIKKLVEKMMDKIKKQDAGSRPFCSAVVPAAGNSTRMAGCNKQFSTLCGIPVLAHTLRNLEACEYVDEIVVATKPEEIPHVANLAAEYGITKLTNVVMGGDSRGASVALGAAACDKRAQLIAVHDGLPGGTQKTIAYAMRRGIEVLDRPSVCKNAPLT